MASERDCVDHLISVSHSAVLSLQEAAALGFLVARKWDRARTAHAAAGQAVTADQVAAFDRFTAQELTEFRAAAMRMLMENAAPANEGWWRGFWQGFAASWAYAASLVVAAVVLRLLSGSDLLTLLRDIVGASR